MQEFSQSTSDDHGIHALAKHAGMLASLAAGAVPVALVLSLAHEVAFYFALHFPFLALLETSDYLKQSIYWAPLAFTSTFVGALFGGKSAKKLEAERNKAITSGNPRDLIKFGSKESRSQFLAFSGVFVALVTPTIFLPWQIIFITIPFFSYIYIPYIFIERLVVTFPKVYIIYYLVSVPVIGLLVVSAVLGLVEAKVKMAAPGAAQATRIYTRLEPNGRDVTVVRYIDKGVLCLILTEKRVFLVPWSDVQKVETLVEGSSSIFDYVGSFASN